jgi:hypothetical protein
MGNINSEVALENLNLELQEWRMKSGGRGRIPLKFWAQARSLGEDLGHEAIADKLSLNLNKLMGRCENPKKPSEVISFSEMKPDPFQFMNTKSIELRFPDGRTLAFDPSAIPGIMTQKIIDKFISVS